MNSNIYIYMIPISGKPIHMKECSYKNTGLYGYTQVSASNRFLRMNPRWQANTCQRLKAGLKLSQVSATLRLFNMLEYPMNMLDSRLLETADARFGKLHTMSLCLDIEFDHLPYESQEMTQELASGPIL